MKSFAAATALTTLFLASTTSASPAYLSERGLLQPLFCVPYNLIISDLSRPAVASQASAYCSSLIAKTTTSTRTSTSVITKTSIVSVLTTDVATHTLAAPTPTVTQTLEYSACGLVGYDKNIVRADFGDDSGSLASFQACGNKCKADANCKSFAYGVASCLLYSVDAGDNVNLNAASPYTFFDRNCPAPSSEDAGSAASAPAPEGRKRGLLSLPVISPPAALVKVQDQVSTNACSCLINSPSTVTFEVLKTATSTSTLSLTTTAVVGTKVVEVYTTPAPVTVTVAAKASA